MPQQIAEPRSRLSVSRVETIPQVDISLRSESGARHRKQCDLIGNVLVTLFVFSDVGWLATLILQQALKLVIDVGPLSQLRHTQHPLQQLAEEHRLLMRHN